MIIVSPGDIISLTVCHMCFSANRPTGLEGAE